MLSGASAGKSACLIFFLFLLPRMSQVAQIFKEGVCLVIRSQIIGRPIKSKDVRELRAQKSVCAALESNDFNGTGAANNNTGVGAGALFNNVVKIAMMSCIVNASPVKWQTPTLDMSTARLAKLNLYCWPHHSRPNWQRIGKSDRSPRKD
jgi:hypothetical protein